MGSLRKVETFKFGLPGDDVESVGKRFFIDGNGILTLGNFMGTVTEWGTLGVDNIGETGSFIGISTLWLVDGLVETASSGNFVNDSVFISWEVNSIFDVEVVSNGSSSSSVLISSFI